MPDDVQGIFGRPFTEQVAFFRRKLANLVPTAAWDDMVGAAHDDGFMVAGAAKADLLTDLAAAVDKSIAEGGGIEAFRKDFQAVVAKNGWTGWTGEGSVKGEAWRVGVIYRTNAYTSYSAGRYAQLQAGGYPFWIYRHGHSKEPRPQHLAWDGLVLPPDHPFWSTHYPPSAWECSCYALGARSEGAAARLGGKLGKSLPAGWNLVDRKTGTLPGIDKGWGYAPGATVSDQVNAIANKIGSWEYQIAKAVFADLPQERAEALGQAYRSLPSTADDARRYAQRIYEPKPDLAPLAPIRTLGLVGADEAARIESATGQSVIGYDFSFDSSAVGHVIRGHGDDAIELASGQRAITADDFGVLPMILSSPDTVTDIGTSAIGEDLVEMRKAIDGETYVARLAIGGAKRKTLALKTMFVLTGK